MALEQSTYDISINQDNGSIDIAGLFKNMLQQGFTTNHCLSELIDDSYGAKATTIGITINTNLSLLIIQDNGIGMNKNMLNKAHRLHSRSAASNDKHGRFGIGRKHALVHFTQNKGNVQTLSKSKDDPLLSDENISELNINFDEVIRCNKYDIKATGIEFKSVKVWNEYAIDPSSHGTITIIRCDPIILNELITIIETQDATSSLIYLLGLTYSKYIQSGNKMSINIIKNSGTVKYAIKVIDPILFNNVIDAKYQYLKNHTVFDIYFDPANKAVRTYFSDKDKYGYFAIDSKKKSKFIRELRTSISSNFRFLGNVSMYSAYSNNWTELQESILRSINLNILTEGMDGVIKFDAFLNGTYLERNGKIITRFPTNKATSGDKARYQFHDKSRHFVSFKSVITHSSSDEDYTLDDVFNIQINKSKIDPFPDDHHIWHTVNKLSNRFISDAYNKYRSKTDTEFEQESEEEQEQNQQLGTKIVQKIGPKVGTNIGTKVDTKPVPKVETNVDTKPVPKVETNVETKPVPKGETNVDTKPVPKGETKVETKPVPKVETKVDTKPVPKVETNVDTKPVPKGETKVETQTNQKIDLKLSNSKNIAKGTKSEILHHQILHAPKKTNVPGMDLLFGKRSETIVSSTILEDKESKLIEDVSLLKSDKINVQSKDVISDFLVKTTNNGLLEQGNKSTKQIISQKEILVQFNNFVNQYKNINFDTKIVPTLEKCDAKLVFVSHCIKSLDEYFSKFLN